MNVLICGDVMGRPGREAVAAHLPRLRRDLQVDVAIVNAENAAHGFGLTEKLCGELYEAGADVLTTGNHVWDQREIIPYIERDTRVLRPANFPAGTPGVGMRRHALADGRQLVVINLMGRLFMDLLDDPFAGLDACLAVQGADWKAKAIVVDFHAEATSEKHAMGHYADGRVSAVVGTHTHVPTADARLLSRGTAYITDIGMCGDYDSVIGLQKDAIVRRFVTRMPGQKPQVAEGEGTLSGAFVVIDDASGRARRIEPVRVGGCLPSHLPRL